MPFISGFNGTRPLKGVGGASKYIAEPGSATYTSPGSYTWTAPRGVETVSVVCVGGGGRTSPVSGFYIFAGGAAALGYKNNISVTPNADYTVVVGQRDGGQSYFLSTGTVRAAGGQRGNPTYGAGAGATSYTGDGGGYGGNGVQLTQGHGGGAGGYSGNGGHGSTIGTCPFNGYKSGQDGAGGGGGGGGNVNSNDGGSSGGGVGIGGEGTSGEGGLCYNQYYQQPTGNAGGRGGSGGGNGGGSGKAGGGNYGGGAAGTYFGSPNPIWNSGWPAPQNGGSGAVRIYWPGDTRQFPSSL